MAEITVINDTIRKENLKKYLDERQVWGNHIITITIQFVTLKSEADISKVHDTQDFYLDFQWSAQQYGDLRIR